MRLHLLGVRGSTPAPGPLHVRYGGHTSAVAISHDGCPPTLVLDAGTGLRTLSDLLAEPAYRGAIALTHLHWDHVQGLPFFAKGDDPAAEVDVYLPAQDGRSGRDLLAGVLSPPYFPILPEGLQGGWTFTALTPGTVTMRGFTVTAFDVEHKGGATFGYRVEDDSGSIAYLPDHAAVSRSATLVDQVRAVDVLIHDAQFLDTERMVASAFGHSTVTDCLEFAAEAGARQLVLVHHAPSRTDSQLDRLSRQLEGRPEIVVGRQDMVIDVGVAP